MSSESLSCAFVVEMSAGSEICGRCFWIGGEWLRMKRVLKARRRPISSGS